MGVELILGIIAGIVALVGGLAQSKQNQWAVQDQNAQNQANFERQISLDNTSVQRRVTDLKAAGLSPTLAAGQGASTPSPISAQPVTTDYMSGINGLMSAPRGITSMLKQSEEIAQTKAQTELLKQQVINKSYEPELIRAQTNASNAAAYKAYIDGGVSKYDLDISRINKQKTRPGTYGDIMTTINSAYNQMQDEGNKIRNQAQDYWKKYTNYMNKYTIPLSNKIFGGAK